MVTICKDKTVREQQGVSEGHFLDGLQEGGSAASMAVTTEATMATDDSH